MIINDNYNQLSDSSGFTYNRLSTSASIRFFLGLRKNTLKTLDKLNKEHFDLMHIGIRAKSFYLVNNPDIIERILVKDYTVFEKTMKGVDSVREKSLLDSPGDPIRKGKHVAQPKLAREWHLEYFNKMNNILETEIARLKELARNSESINLHEEIEFLMLKLVMGIFFSEEITEDERYICKTVHEASKQMKKNALNIFPKIFTKKNESYEENVNAVYTYISKLMEKRKAMESKPDDLLNDVIYQNIEKEARAYGKVYNDLITILPAAFETPAKAITFTINNILTHDNTKQKVYQEMEDYQGNMSDLQELKYLNASLYETMRMYPPVWMMTRQNNTDIKISDIDIPKGSIFLFSQYMMHRNSKYWKNPDQFNPERFMNGIKDIAHKYAYFPFGGGPSRCVGNQFAFVIMPLVIFTILRNFDIKILEKMEVDTVITMYPKNGLWVNLGEK